jgi:hypothetical protein
MISRPARKIHSKASSAQQYYLYRVLAAWGDAQPFSDEAPMLLSGRRQSVNAIDLAVFWEEEFGVDFADIGFDRR